MKSPSHLSDPEGHPLERAVSWGDGTNQTKAGDDTENFQGNPLHNKARKDAREPTCDSGSSTQKGGLGCVSAIPARPGLNKRDSEKLLEDAMGGFVPLFKRPEMVKPDPLTGLSIEGRIDQYQKTIETQGWNGGAVEGLLKVIDEIVVLVKGYKEKAGKAELASLEAKFKERMASSKHYYAGAAVDMQQEAGWDDGETPTHTHACLHPFITSCKPLSNRVLFAV
jgi:hypothetical protein